MHVEIILKDGGYEVSHKVEMGWRCHAFDTFEEALDHLAILHGSNKI